jgi:hypothetical protein
MMNFDTIIETLTEIINNDKIYKQGLVLQYELDPETHIKMNEELFYRTEQTTKFEPSDLFDVVIENVRVVFIKK